MSSAWHAIAFTRRFCGGSAKADDSVVISKSLMRTYRLTAWDYYGH